MLHRFLEVVLSSGLLGQVPTIDAPEIKKPVQEMTILATVRLVNKKEKCTGAGVILASPKGKSVYILTAAHLVRDVDSVDVHVFSREAFHMPDVYPAVPVFARSTKDNQDLALLRIAVFVGKPIGMKVCPIAQLPREKAFTAFASGCEDAKPPTLRPVPIQDSVLAAKKDTRPARFWQSASKPGLGASGGPLVNSQGQLLGICSGVQREHGYYGHLEDIIEFLKEHVK